ncbi:hypothetical protein Tco_0940618 [Tanacetum coccineum]|uniref:Uncharacterized protein n=1 Tax=Tanacetum coccineum TaxID=301880 RepID=A0ABQ5DR28_9ASTR
MDDGPSRLKRWKSKFFLIDRRAILDHLTRRHSHSYVSDDLPTDGYNRNDVKRLRVHLICLREMKEEVLVRSGLSFVWSNKECDLVFRRKDDNFEMSIYDFMTLPSWGDAKIVEETHHLFDPLLERVPSHTTALTAYDALIMLPTLNEVAAAQPDPHFARKSKGPSQVRVQSASATASEPSQPSKKRRLKKRASEFGSSAPELETHHLFDPLLERVPSHTTALTAYDALIMLPTLNEVAAAQPDPHLQAEGLNEANITDFCTELEDRMERDEGTSIRTDSVPTPPLGKRLGPPPSMVVASISGPPFVGTSTHASTSVADGFARKSGAEVMRRQMNPLDALVRSALSRDAEYDEIPKDDFDTATRSEEIELTLFLLAPGPYHMSYPYEDVCRKALDRTITPAELRRTESLLPLELSNRVNILSALLVSHGMKFNSRYTDLVASRVRLQEKLDQKTGYVKVLHSEVTSLDDKLDKVQRDSDALGQENKELRSQRDVASEEGYMDAVDELRTEVTQFISSGVEGLVRRLLSSDEFHAALAHVASIGINYGVERGLRMGSTDANFEAAARKVSNFHIGAKADFNKALVAFPTTLFPFLGKVVAAVGGSLSEMTQILPDKLARSATLVPIIPPIVNEASDQVPHDRASNDSASSI